MRPTTRSEPFLTAAYLDFDRAAWARLRAATPLTLDEHDLAHLQGLNAPVSLPEVEAIYLPLSRLLNLQVAATQTLHKSTDTFLGTLPRPIPFVIGIAGSVAVGKSTFARILRALLSRWPAHPRVDLVTTDGFLFPNAVLESRGILDRKGFPESYDLRRLVEFMSESRRRPDRSTRPSTPTSRTTSCPATFRSSISPDIVLVEGLNVLQTGGPAEGVSSVSLDFFDFSIYIDADEEDIERWYVERFLALRETVFQDPRSYFHRYAGLTEAEAIATSRGIWQRINGVNLRENVKPTRERARLVLEKGSDHAVRRVRLRRT